jgi:hypothetical protein
MNRLISVGLYVFFHLIYSNFGIKENTNWAIFYFLSIIVAFFVVLIPNLVGRGKILKRITITLMLALAFKAFLFLRLFNVEYKIFKSSINSDFADYVIVGIIGIGILITVFRKK